MVNVAVIGCGYWGPNLIRNFNQIKLTNVVSVCDLDVSKMEAIKKNYPFVKTTSNYLDLLEDPNVDAIVIALPVARHYQIARDALLHNKHVLVEKPLVASVKEAEDLIRIANKNKKVLMVDHTFEYAQAINKIKSIIESGELGDIYYIKAEWLNLGLLQPDVNVVWDLATHISSIVSYVTGLNPISLSAQAGAYIREDNEEIAHLFLRFPKRITAYLTVSWLEPKKTRSLTIVGSKKMLAYNLMNEEEQIKIFDKGVDITKDIEDKRQFRINYRYGSIYIPFIEKVEPLKEMCTHFADCIINNKVPRSDGLSGLNVVRILEAAQHSIENNGTEIKLDQINFNSGNDGIK
jgi:predicted dehydrogenase